jgi:hypothetical protein
MAEVAAVRQTPTGSNKGGGSWWCASKAWRRQQAQGVGATATRLGQGRPWRAAAGVPYVEGATELSGGCWSERRWRSRRAQSGPPQARSWSPRARPWASAACPGVGVRPWHALVLSEEFGGCLLGQIGGGRWAAALGHVGCRSTVALRLQQ